MSLAKRLFVGLASFVAFTSSSKPVFSQVWTDVMFRTVENISQETRTAFFYDYNEKTGKKQLLAKYELGDWDLDNFIDSNRVHFNHDNGRLRIVFQDTARTLEYNRDEEKWAYVGMDKKGIEKAQDGGANFLPIPGVVGNADGTVNVGIGNRTITLDGEGVAVGGKSLVRREINAAGEEELHMGDNSLVTVESDGELKLYANDANGKRAPINITEGSDLQINGVSVQGQIDDNADDIEANTKAIDSVQDNMNDLGFGVAGATALSTAMSALPTVAQDSPLSCGVGTGGYSSRFAMSVGCAVKANDRLSINAGGSYVFGGSADYGNGSLSTAAARAGFVFKFGKLETPAASNEQLQSQLNEVKDENEELRARLERLEAIALGNQPASKTVSLK